MRSALLTTLAASALLLAGGAAQAQQTGTAQQAGTAMPQQGGQTDGMRPGMMGQDDGRGMMDRHEGRRHKRMACHEHGRHGWGPERMGPNMMTMMTIMMDTNGDGALSLEEIQAVHARMFNYADTNKDGKLTPDEMRRFFHGNVEAKD